MYDYSISMSLKSDLARYIYKRLSHYWTQASKEHPYQPKLVSFLEQSPRGLSGLMKDNMRAMRTALKRLVDHNVIVPDWIEIPIKDPLDKRVTKDIQFELYPHDNFIKHILKANKKQSDIRGQVGITDAREATKPKKLKASKNISRDVADQAEIIPDDGTDCVFD